MCFVYNLNYTYTYMCLYVIVGEQIKKNKNKNTLNKVYNISLNYTFKKKIQNFLKFP